MMAKTKNSLNHDLQDEKMNRITENKSSKSANAENPASDKWEIPSDWKVMQLGQLGTFSKGKGILKEQVIKEGFPCIRYGEIYTRHDFIIKDFKSFISENLAEESKEIKNGDILFAGSGETVEEIGKAVAYIKDEKAYAGGDIIILSTKKETNVSCLSYILETDFVKKQKRVLGQGNSVVHIYSSDLSKIKIPLPPLPEQTAIAQLLSTWDNAITNTQALIAQKEQRKKWLMQKLLTGKMRLKGFSSEWKKIRIEDVLINYQNGYAFSSADYFEKGIPIITMAQIGLDGTFQYDNSKVNYWREDNVSNLENFLLKKGDLIIAMTDVTPTKNLIGRMAIINIDGPFLLNQRVGFLRIDTSKVNPTILAAISGMKYWRDYSRSHATLGVQANLGTSDIKNAIVKLPSIEEQNAIAKVLQAADKEIQLLKTKCDKLKEQKKGLMQVLLTGKKRLII